jgi:hypothetical protein
MTLLLLPNFSRLESGRNTGRAITGSMGRKRGRSRKRVAAAA